MGLITGEDFLNKKWIIRIPLCVKTKDWTKNYIYIYIISMVQTKKSIYN